MEINFAPSKTSYKKLVLNVRNFFATKGFGILVFISIALLAYCGYLWYKFIAHPQWSESQKQEYANTQGKESVFDQKKFDAVVDEIKLRKNEYDKKIENIPDIFKLK